MGSALFCVAGLVTTRLAPEEQKLDPGGMHVPRVGAIKRGPRKTCFVGPGRHGKALKGLLDRYFG